jgi:hypothetical protein
MASPGPDTMKQAFDSRSDDAEAGTWASINWRRLAVHVYIANISKDIPPKATRLPPPSPPTNPIHGCSEFRKISRFFSRVRDVISIKSRLEVASIAATPSAQMINVLDP